MNTFTQSVIIGALAATAALAQVPPVPPVPPAPPAAVRGFAFAPEPPTPPDPPPPPAAMQVLISGGSFLGVNVQEIDADRAKSLKLKEERGVEITTVQESSPAEKAGLKKGDVVTEYNGQRIEGTEQFIRFVRETPAGRTVKLSVIREGSPTTVSALIGTRRAARTSSRNFEWLSENFPNVRIPDIPRPHMSWRSGMLGVEAESLDGQLAQYFGVKEGVLIRSVAKDSPAEKAGLKAGDVVVKVDQKDVDSPNDISNAIRDRGERKTVSLAVVRDKKETPMTVTFEEGADRPRSGQGQRARRVTEHRF